MSTLVLPKETGRTLIELTGEPRLEVALTLVIRDYARRKAEVINAAIRRYEDKYKMSFDEYKRRWETIDRKEDYTLEAEEDYLDWEALVTRRSRLEAAFAWLP